MDRAAVLVDRVADGRLRDQLQQVANLVLWDDLPAVGHAAIQAIFTYHHPPVTEELMGMLPGLRVISNFGVGVDHIDLRAAARRQIPVGHTPGVLDKATADLGFALLLASARRIVQLALENERTSGPPPPLGREVHGSTLGIIGLGRIGQQVARRAHGFDMRVLYYQRRQHQDDASCAVTYVSLQELLAQSDFVMLTLPLTSQTRHLINDERLGWMRPTATLVNIARGAIVDTDALTEALRCGRLAAAALDVTEPEPLPAEHPLRHMPQVLITPHIGSATDRTRRRMGQLAMANLVAGLEGRPLPAEVKWS